MIVRRSTEADVTAVLQDARQADRLELLAVSFQDDFGGVVREVVGRMKRGDSMTTFATDEGLPVAFLMQHIVRPNTLAMGMVSTNLWSVVARPATRWCVTRYRPSLARSGIRRIEAASHVEHEISHRWLQFLGFRREGLMADFGKHGEAFYLFGMTGDVLSSRDAE
jgi:hypothetical protein